MAGVSPGQGEQPGHERPHKVVHAIADRTRKGQMEPLKCSLKIYSHIARFYLDVTCKIGLQVIARGDSSGWRGRRKKIARKLLAAAGS